MHHKLVEGGESGDIELRHFWMIIGSLQRRRQQLLLVPSSIVTTCLAVGVTVQQWSPSVAKKHYRSLRAQEKPGVQSDFLVLGPP